MLADERRFATAARVSEINLALYRAFAQPVVRAMTSAPLADAMRQLHPLRLQYELFSDANPLMAPVKAMAERASEDRQPAARTTRSWRCRKRSPSRSSQALTPGGT